MGDYEFSLRHASVREGEWAGFMPARQGLGGVAGLGARPYRRWRPWIPSATDPNNLAAGSWGAWQWQIDAALLDGLVGTAGAPPLDGRTAADMRADLLAFTDLPGMQLLDLDGAIYTVQMVGYTEQALEPFDARHPNGGWVAQITLVEL